MGNILKGQNAMRFIKKCFLVFFCLLLIQDFAGCARKPAASASYNNLPGNLGCVAESDDSYYILVINSVFRVDKKTGEVSPACRDATCSHGQGMCVYNHEVICIKNYNGKILLLCRDIPTIYEMNPDTYALSVYLEMDKMPFFFEFYDQYLIYSYSESNDGKGGWAALNLATGEEHQLLDRLSFRCYFGIDQRFIYLSTTEHELFRVDIDSGEKQLIIENCRDCVLYGGKLYYIGYNPETETMGLCTAAPDGSGETMLIPGVSVFQIYQDQIFYTDSNKQILKSDLSGSAPFLLIDGVENDYFLLLPGADQIIAGVQQWDQYARFDLDGGSQEIILTPDDFIKL